jgi:hypothetical protein
MLNVTIFYGVLVVGWKQFTQLACEHQEETRQLIHIAKLLFKHQPTRIKYGFQVTNTHHDAMLLDNKAGNTLWKEVESNEIKELMDYKVFKDLGKGGIPPSGYKKKQMTYGI